MMPIMVTSPDQQESSLPFQRINLLENSPTYLGPKIEIPGAQLGVDRWSEMIGLTQSDGKERGIIVSSILGRLATSSIFSGSDKSITHPFLPHGIKSLWPFAKYLTHVHTHPMPEELNHLQTSLISDSDIRAFTELNYKAIAMIDRGGVHILLRTAFADFKEPLPNFNLSHAALDKAKAGENTTVAAIRELANILYPHDIRYYYSPNLSPNGEVIQLADARTF